MVSCASVSKKTPTWLSFPALSLLITCLSMALFGFSVSSLGQDSVGDAFTAALLAQSKGDFATARRLLEPLAENGHPFAQHNLGMIYLGGLGVEKDEAKAASLAA